MTTESVTLFADDLWSKFGFGDGDCLDDILFDAEDESDWPWANLQPRQVAGRDDEFHIDHELLIRVVERFLVPQFPVPVALERVGTCHNPIRAVDQGHVPAPSWALAISVTVSAADVLKIAAEIAEERMK